MHGGFSVPRNHSNAVLSSQLDGTNGQLSIRQAAKPPCIQRLKFYKREMIFLYHINANRTVLDFRGRMRLVKRCFIGEKNTHYWVGEQIAHSRQNKAQISRILTA